METSSQPFAVFPHPVVVVEDEPKPAAGRTGRPLQHLQVSIGIAEGQDRAAADVALDADRFTLFVVDEMGLAGLGMGRQFGRTESLGTSPAERGQF